MSREVLQQALEKVADALPAYIDGVASREYLAVIHKALAQPYPEYDRGFSNGWDKCAARQVTQPDNTSKLYEELRVLIDGGSESFTHNDAVQYLKDNLAPLKLTPEDMAHRPGGLAQAELSDYQCCDCKTRLFCGADCHVCGSFSAEDIPQEHPEQMARLGWQYVECPACGSEGARAFPKPEESTIKQSLTVEHEPVELETVHEAIVHWDEGGGKRSRRELARRIVDLYISPPQRQPLTPEEIAEVAERMEATDAASSFWREFARAIEAKHGIGDKT